MLPLSLEQSATLRDWLLPDQPGPLVGLHVLNTGHGTCWVDRWPEPRAAFFECAANWSLIGDPEAVLPDDLQGQVAGFLDAPVGFVPVLRAAFPDLVVWDRVMFELETPPRFSVPPETTVRLLTPADVTLLQGLDPELNWIGKTWGDAAGLAASGTAWGAFVKERLAAIACTFYMGERYEDIGIVTEPAFRGRGFGPACAGAACRGILARGRRPSWTTSPDNIASIRVAEKLGFTQRRRGYLYVVGIPVPRPARRQSD
jgi:RimJ/RimL family protein N-acetyltransferase